MFVMKTYGDDKLLRSINWLDNFPWIQENEIRREGNSYEVCLQVKDFDPKDITVKIEDSYIVVEAKHEERKDEHGYISRHFKRKYSLPKDCISEKVESKLSSDGWLTITAPLKVGKKDTVIPVIRESKVKSKL